MAAQTGRTIASLALRKNDALNLVRQLEAWKGRKIRKVNTKAVREGLKPAASAAKRNAPVDTKRLRKSIGRKVKGYPNGNVIGLVGMRAGHRLPYWHLVVFGHRIAIGGSLIRERGRKAGTLGNSKRAGRVGGFVKGNEWIRRALEQNSVKMVKKYTSTLKEQIAKEAKKK